MDFKFVLGVQYENYLVSNIIVFGVFDVVVDVVVYEMLNCYFICLVYVQQYFVKFEIF